MPIAKQCCNFLPWSPNKPPAHMVLVEGRGPETKYQFGVALLQSYKLKIGSIINSLYTIIWLSQLTNLVAACMQHAHVGLGWSCMSNVYLPLQRNFISIHHSCLSLVIVDWTDSLMGVKAWVSCRPWKHKSICCYSCTYVMNICMVYIGSTVLYVWKYKHSIQKSNQL